MGFLRKLNPFDRDDDKKEEHQQEQSSEGAEASSDSGSASGDVSGMAAATAEAATDSATAVAEPVIAASEAAEVVVAETVSDAGVTVTEVAAASVSTEGTVAGGGLFRTYTTKAGDSLEDIAAYFYGAAVQKQRLLDDNPFLSSYGDTALPSGIQIHVGEDAARGDAIPGQEAAAAESASGETPPA